MIWHFNDTAHSLHKYSLTLVVTVSTLSSSSLEYCSAQRHSSFTAMSSSVLKQHHGWVLEKTGWRKRKRDEMSVLWLVEKQRKCQW